MLHRRFRAERVCKHRLDRVRAVFYVARAGRVVEYSREVLKRQREAVIRRHLIYVLAPCVHKAAYVYRVVGFLDRAARKAAVLDFHIVAVAAPALQVLRRALDRPVDLLLEQVYTVQLARYLVAPFGRLRGKPVFHFLYESLLLRRELAYDLVEHLFVERVCPRLDLRHRQRDALFLDLYLSVLAEHYAARLKMFLALLAPAGSVNGHHVIKRQAERSALSRDEIVLFLKRPREVSVLFGRLQEERARRYNVPCSDVFALAYLVVSLLKLAAHFVEYFAGLEH